MLVEGLNQLNLDLDYALRMMAAVSVGYSLAGDFSVEARRGAEDGWARFVVRKNRDSEFGFTADFGFDGKLELKGLPQSADEFLIRLIGADARTVLAATEKTAQLWDVVTGKTLGAALPHDDLVYHAAFTPDGKVLLTASGSPDTPGEVRLWDVATGKAFCTVPTKNRVAEAVFSPDGTVLLLASEKEARLWQVPKLSK